MEKKNITLKQIAEKVGVSATTVHRVLSNKGGCSEVLKEKILKIAEEEGYSVNYVASSLRKRTVHIALLFTKSDESFRYYLQEMLEGYKAYKKVINQFNIVFDEYFYSGTENGEESYLSQLKKFEQDIPVHYDGLLIFGLLNSEKVSSVLNRLIGKGVSIVVLEKEIISLEGSMIVKPDDCIAGGMAGDLLVKMTGNNGTIVVFEQDLPNKDLNGEAFQEELRRLGSNIQICRYPLSIQQEQGKYMKQILEKTSELKGIYITSARHTAAYLKSCEEFSRMGIAVVGSEIFDETYEALQENRLDAVIDKRPYDIGYKALQFLFDKVIKYQNLPECYRVVPRVILRSNSDEYFKRKENRNGKRKCTE